MAGSCPLNYGERSFEKCSLKYNGGLGEGFIWSSYAEKHLWHVEELRTSTMMLILPVFRVMTDSNPAFKVSQLSLTCLVAWLNFRKSASSCVICCGGKFEKSWRTYIKEADREKQTNSACVVLLRLYLFLRKSLRRKQKYGLYFRFSASSVTHVCESKQASYRYRHHTHARKCYRSTDDVDVWNTM